MPGVTVEFHRLAARELRKACEWYEKQGAGLGRSLAAEVDRAAERIAADPQRWPIFRKQYRWVRLHRFPYVLYYHAVEPNGILADYEDQNDHDALRHDAVFKLIAGRSPDGDDLASQPTLSRFENAIGPASLRRLQDVFIDQFIASFATPPTQLTFDPGAPGLA